MDTFYVEKRDENLSLVEFISKSLSEAISKKEIKRRIEDNYCMVNGGVERVASRKLAWKDRIEWEEKRKVPTQKALFESSRILYEDADLLVYNKPSGVECDVEGIVRLLKTHGRFFLVHRLDKFTSGALILAKTREAEKALLAFFKEREMDKCYLALADGVPKIKKGFIENYLGKVGGFQGQTNYGSVKPPLGKFAKTSWSVKNIYKNASLIVCYPETGRTHQIRVHLSELGHPILGDYQYGKKFVCKIKPPRMLLHAYKIEFKHPMEEKMLKITAPIPKDFQDMIKALT